MSTRKLALYGKGTGPRIPCFGRPSRLIVVGGAVDAAVDGNIGRFEPGTHDLGQIGTVAVNSAHKVGSCFVECD